MWFPRPGHYGPTGVRITAILLCLCIAFFIVPPKISAEPPIRAFPGAEGFGAYTPGGRGGDVYHVTNLNDNGPGSLRYGVENAAGPRTIVFDISGTIELEDNIIVTNPYMTFAGQTAPGQGITLKNFFFRVKTHDVIIRYMRFRAGSDRMEPDPHIRDSFSLMGDNIIADHVSASWGLDETMDTVGSNITVQWSVISEGLSLLKRSYGYLIEGRKDQYISMHHNIFAHNGLRNPFIAPYSGTTSVDFRNNVLYDWGGYPVYLGRHYNEAKIRINYVGNYLKTLRDVSSFYYLDSNGIGGNEIYLHDSLLDNGIVADDYGWPKVHVRIGSTPPVELSQPFYIPQEKQITTDLSSIAYEKVLKNAGTTFPYRDPVDQRVINQIKEGIGEFIDCSSPGIIYFPDTGVVEADTDSVKIIPQSSLHRLFNMSGREIEVYEGTGTGQKRKIVSYSHEGRNISYRFRGDRVLIIVDRDWDIIPDTTSKIRVLTDGGNNGGGYPDLISKPALADTDQDGMPDKWEISQGLNIYDPEDRNNDSNGDGYTNLEEYLNSLVQPVLAIELSYDGLIVDRAKLGEIIEMKDSATGNFPLVKNTGDLPVFVDIGYGPMIEAEGMARPGLEQGPDTFITKNRDNGIIIPPNGKGVVTGCLEVDDEYPMLLLFGAPTELSESINVIYELRAVCPPKRNKRF